jgi:putative transposase
MSRPLRIEFPGAIYHVMARGVNGIRTFRDGEDYGEFLRLVGLLVRDQALIVHTLALMPTHPHLLCETPFGGLGRWMCELLSQYSRYYNRRYARTGHLWQARYKAILVEDSEYLAECSRYIHLNPNRQKLTRPAEMWPWSSYRNYVGGPAVVDWVQTKRVLAHFSDSLAYRAYVESGRDEDPISPFERATAGQVLGSPAYVQQIRELEKKLRPSRGATGRRALRRSAPMPGQELIRAAVDEHFAELSSCKRRQLLAYYLHRLTWLKTVEIAELLERSPAAISMARSKIEDRALREPEFAAGLTALEEKIRGQFECLPLTEKQDPQTPEWYRRSLLLC